ncbi:hypothetical protein J7L67_04240, partial [bacterium]|nr:hypothetical protein [bacterium]
MRKEMLKLLAVQDIDLKIIELKKLQKSLPETLELLKKDVEQKKIGLENAKQSLQDTKSAQKSIEMDISSNKQTVVKYQNQLLQIKSNVQYKALLSEIKSIDKKSSQLEDKLLDKMMQADKNQQLISDAQDDLKKSEQRLTNEENNIKNKIVEVNQETTRLNEQRKQIASDINKRALKIYEKIIKKKQPAIVTIHEKICEGCFMKLTPNDANEVHKGK